VPDNIRKVTTSATVGGKQIPLLSWSCHLTSYGNLCTFDCVTSIQQLKTLGVDIFSIQNSTPNLECIITLTETDDTGSAVTNTVFDGIVDEIEGTWEDDLITISGRDYSAILRDQSNNVPVYTNQTVTDIVTNIAKLYDLKTHIVSNSQMAGIRASAYQGQEWAYVLDPKPLWHVIQELADEAGYVAWVDQYKTLHFEPPGDSGINWDFNWRPALQNTEQGSSADGMNPILKLSWLDQARQYANFTLILHGYDPNAKSPLVRQTKRGDGSGHLFHVSRQDVNSENIKQLTENIADEMSRKQLVAKLVVDGDTGINVNDQIQIFETEEQDLLGLSGQQMFIVSVVQQFSMADYGTDSGEGFLTHITCNKYVKPTLTS